MPQYPSFVVPHVKNDDDTEEEDVMDRAEVQQWRMAVFDRFIDEDSDEEEEEYEEPVDEAEQYGVRDRMPEYSQNAMAAAVSIMDSAEKK